MNITSYLEKRFSKDPSIVFRKIAVNAWHLMSKLHNYIYNFLIIRNNFILLLIRLWNNDEICHYKSVSIQVDIFDLYEGRDYNSI